jgi:hypothetical protein
MPPDAWRTLRLALLRTPGWATHRLVVQDDALPVPRAALLATETVEACPGAVIALFVGRHHSLFAHRFREAQQHGRPFAEAPDGWFPTVATVYPVGDAFALPYFAEKHQPLADDEIVGRYLRERRRLAMIRVPSLFDHDDGEPSLINKLRGYPRGAVALEAPLDAAAGDPPRDA